MKRDEVAEIYDDLRRNGVRPSAKKIREVLEARRAPGEEVGSLGTIQVFLGELQNSDASVTPPARAGLPRALLAAIEQTLHDAAKSARAEVEAQVAELEKQAQELAFEGQAAEHRREEAAQLLTVRTSERDMVLGQLKDQTAVAERLDEALRRGQQSCEQARLELARAQASAVSAAERLADVQSQADAALGELASMREALRVEAQLRVDAEKRAGLAELRASLLDAQVAGAAEARAEAEARLRALEDAVTANAAQESMIGELRTQLDFLRRLHSQRSAKAGKPAGTARPAEAQTSSATPPLPEERRDP